MIPTDTPVNIGDGLDGWKVYRCYDDKVEIYRNRGQGRVDRKTVSLEEIEND